MVARRTYTHEEQSALCLQARAGDRAAADDLARAVWPWCRRKAGEYGKRYRVDPDDLESAGMARLPLAVRTFDPAQSTFLNYFANAASRAMLKLARAESARPEVTSHEAGVYEPGKQEDDHPACSPVEAALAQLCPADRWIVERVLVQKASLDRAAEEIGMSVRRAEVAFRAAFNRLSDQLAAV